MKRRDFVRGCGGLACGLLASTGAEAGKAAPSESPREASVHSAADTWVEVDLNHIRFNLSQIRKKVEGRPIMAVIKCNAYGHGLSGLGRFLDREEGVAGLAVGKLSEGAALREAGVRRPILNFGPFCGEDAEAVLHYDISPSIYTDAVTALDQAAAGRGKIARIHINIDTGLGRVGIPYHVALPFLKKVARLKHIRIAGIFQAFSEEKVFDAVQLERFVEVISNAKRLGIDVGLRHAASSTAVFGSDDPYFLDMVRPGIAIYGHYPTDEEFELKRMELRPALTLKTRVAYVKTLRPGDGLSYFRKFKAERPEPIATLPMGYSDGVPLSLPDHARILINGVEYPLFADISANHSYVRLGPGGESRVRIGDEAVLIGKQGKGEIHLWDVYRATGTAPYKILINLNPVLPRRYRT